VLPLVAVLPSADSWCMRVVPAAVRGHHPGLSVVRGARSVLASLREFNAVQVEMHERMALLEQPWREELLHWSHDGREWRLHGHRLPPARGRPRSVTRGGWCPGNRPSCARHG
jgi:hypothetical protein